MKRLSQLGKKRLVVRAIATLCVLSVSLVVMVAWQPSDYRPLRLPPEKHQQMRNHLIAAEQAFTENLRAEAGPFTYHIYQDDVNQWLAMRHEIYPGVDEWMPQGLSDPFILFEDGAVTLMGRYDTGAGSVLLSMDIMLEMRAEKLVLQVEGLRCGVLGVPMTFIDGLDEPFHRESGDTWPGSPAMSGDLAGGLHLDSKAWWQNGGIAYRLNNVRVADGQIDLDIEPLGPRAQMRLNRQTAASLSD